jgi:hypothetical protein
MSDTEARAAAARQLLDNPLLAEAFANVRAAAIEAWTETSVIDAQKREIAWLTVKVVDRIVGELESVIVNGKIAARRVQAPVR